MTESAPGTDSAPSPAPLPANDFVSRVIRAEDPSVTSRTILLTGSSRGGTSMLSATVNNLGICTGKDFGTYEDHEIGRAADAEDWTQVEELARSRDQRNEVWAWKRPALVLYLEKVLPLLRNPSVVMIYKDLLAVAHRKELVRQKPYLELLASTTDFYRLMAKLCLRLSCPLFLVSYEGASRDPARYTRELAEFVGVTDAQRIEEAIGRQQANKEEYLRIQGRHLAERLAASKESQVRELPR